MLQAEGVTLSGDLMWLMSTLLPLNLFQTSLEYLLWNLVTARLTQ